MADLIGQSIGQYEIVALLGEGGMATVYRARHLSTEREVALKVIKPIFTDSPYPASTFLRVTETVASLNHRHILKLYDYGQEGEIIYLVMELLTGGSLADLIKQGPLPLETTKRLLDQVAQALDYAHKRGIIHLDLKPRNVLFDGEGNAVVIDFGIIKLLSDAAELADIEVIMGTPQYMAPEQWQGRPVDARADVYALGVMLFEMLAGRLPFVADTPIGLMNEHLYYPPPSICELRPDLPSRIERVINRALAKNPDQRYASAGDLAAAFSLPSDSGSPTMLAERDMNRTEIFDTQAGLPALDETPVEFSAFYPGVAQPGLAYALPVFAHIAMAYDKVRELAASHAAVMGSEPHDSKTQATIHLDVGNLLTLIPIVPNVTFVPAEQMWRRAKIEGEGYASLQHKPYVLDQCLRRLSRDKISLE